MLPPQKTIRPERVRLASAFAEPASERLQLVESGQECHLLAFVRPVPPRVTAFLKSIGAVLSTKYQAECDAAVWELPDAGQSKSAVDLLAIDQTIASGLRTIDGKYPAGAGYWFYGSPQPDAPAQATSQLLRFSEEIDSPTR